MCFLPLVESQLNLSNSIGYKALGSKKYQTQRADTPACAPKSGQKPERKVLLEEKEKRKEKSPGAPGIGGVEGEQARPVPSAPK